MDRQPTPTFETDARLRRELRTVEAMIGIYCRRHHRSPHGSCEECAALLAYARERLARCPFGSAKPTCANCTVHCYRPDMRDRVREVMRKAGPHMLYRHPHLAFMHLVVDARRTAPKLPRRGKG